MDQLCDKHQQKKINAKVNDVGEKMGHKYGETDTGMPIYMDDISVAGGSQEDE